MPENRKQLGVDVCGRAPRNRIKEMEFPSGKAKHKPPLTEKDKNKADIR